MFSLRIGRSSLRVLCPASRSPGLAALRPALRKDFQARGVHNRPPQYIHPRSTRRQKEELEFVSTAQQYNGEGLPDGDYAQFSNQKIRYLRPAIWAIVVSGGIFVSLAYLEAKKQLKSKSHLSWPQPSEWGVQKRKAPTPTEAATKWWQDLDPISRLSCSIIAANTAVHLTSFPAYRYWDLLWHIPARNVNYTLLTSAFVHSGPMHLLVNMWATYNFMPPVGYSRLFEGNPNHTLSFFLSAGVLSGFAQHWSTLITTQKRAVPEIFIRCGGASGALFGILGAFCMQYPNAQLGILFLPFKFEAQYFLPAIMIFDLVGIVRGYSFVNFGHAVSSLIRSSTFRLIPSRLICQVP